MKVILLPMAIFLSGSLVAQNSISFRKGQKLEVLTTQTASTTMTMMGQEVETSINTEVVQVFDVEEVSGGNTVIEHKMKRMKFNTESSMGQNLSFDSEKADDLKTEYGKGLEKGLKNKYKVTVNQQGIITDVKEGKENIVLRDDDMATLLLAQLNINAGAPKAGDVILFRALPARELKTGDRWTEEKAVEGGTSKISYHVVNITEKDIIVDFTEEITVQTTQNIMGSEANVTRATKSTGQIIADKHSGILIRRSATMDLSQNMEVQGLTIPSTTRMTTTTQVSR